MFVLWLLPAPAPFFSLLFLLVLHSAQTHGAKQPQTETMSPKCSSTLLSVRLSSRTAEGIDVRDRKDREDFKTMKPNRESIIKWDVCVTIENDKSSG